MDSLEKTTERESGQGKSALSISLPKLGGAIRGIVEKFAANPVIGTFSMTMTVDTSPRRFVSEGFRRIFLDLTSGIILYLMNEIE